jgi:hypothetical protein
MRVIIENTITHPFLKIKIINFKGLPDVIKSVELYVINSISIDDSDLNNEEVLSTLYIRLLEVYVNAGYYFGSVNRMNISKIKGSYYFFDSYNSKKIQYMDLSSYEGVKRDLEDL